MSDRQPLVDYYYSSHYSRRNVIDDRFLERRAEYYERRFGDVLPAQKDVPILEIGCGVGDLLLFLGSLGYSKLHGVDKSGSMVEQCQRRGLNVELSDALDFLKESKTKFQIVFALDFVEHVQPQRLVPLMESVYRHLLPNGLVILSTPNMSNPLNLRSRHADLTHQTGFSKESLEQLLRVSGFDVLRVRGEFSPHSRWYARLIYDRLIWWLVKKVMRGTFRLRYEIIPGKNLLAIGTRSPQDVSTKGCTNSPGRHGNDRPYAC